MPPVDRDAVELTALEESHADLRVLEEDYVKAIQPLPMSRATARMWTTCSPESTFLSASPEPTRPNAAH